MAIPRVKDPLAVAKAVTVLGVIGLALAALWCILWLAAMEPAPTATPPTTLAPAATTAPAKPAPPSQPRTSRRAQYPGSTGAGPSGTGVVTPAPTLAPGVQPL